MASCEAQLVRPSLAMGYSPGSSESTAGLPTGFPRHVDTNMAWVGSQLTNAEDFILRLTSEDVAEAELALSSFKALGLDGDHICRENFPLPKLGPKIEQVRQAVHVGRGFAIIRGLNPGKYLVEDMTMLYLGLQAFVADRRGRQDDKGNMLVHITADESSSLSSGHHRHSRAPITFHTEEAGDIVSWLTRSTAVSGGKCILASCHTIYNILANDRPDMIRALAGSDWPFALPTFQCRPILFRADGRLMMNFGRTPLLGNNTHPRPAGLPSLSARQLEALNAIEQIARATEIQIQTQVGDIHFINNLAILHRRDGFVDGDPMAAGRRHLVRMRLRDTELGWPIPLELQEEWSMAFEDQGVEKTWHLEPMPSGYFPLRKRPN